MSTSNSSDSRSNIAIRKVFRDHLGERVRFDEPLAPHLAYRVGGPADILVFPQTEDDLTWIATAAQTYQIPVTIVGTGTNLLVEDEGIRGITVSLSHAFKTIERVARTSAASESWIECGAGVEKPRLLAWAIAEGLSGLEFSAGVPGTLGGGIYMNAGTKYGCYGDILKQLRVFDFKSGFQTLHRHEVHFGYREQNAVRDTLVTSVVLELLPGDRKAMQTEVDRIIAERAEKQPLDFPSCGSTFKNPEGHSAGRLIERAGLKGLSVGGAEISLKHANFILNKGNATAKDILSLITLIKERVKAHSGVSLECEVIILPGTREP